MAKKRDINNLKIREKKKIKTLDNLTNKLDSMLSLFSVKEDTTMISSPIAKSEPKPKVKPLKGKNRIKHKKKVERALAISGKIEKRKELESVKLSKKNISKTLWE